MKFHPAVTTPVRTVLWTATAVVMLAAAYPWLVDRVGGDFDPSGDAGALSDGARAMIEHAFADVEPARLRDYHVHVVGVDSGTSGTWINPRLVDWRYPIDRIKGDVYFSSSGISDRLHADVEFLSRFTRLARHMPGRFHLLAFDHHYDDRGRIDLQHSEFYTPNAYVYQIAAKSPQQFVPVISLHPSRPDALARLKVWADKGVRYVKWLPNAQGIDAMDERAKRFYRVMRENNMVLLTHVGEEQAVHAKEAQALGNPLRFRAALRAGVRVIMAHSASLGEDDDLENGGRRPSFDLFMSLMEQPQFRGVLFGELSAMTQFNRLPGPLFTLLARDDLHDRLVNGSDYPLPAVNILIQTRALFRHGLISAQQRQLLNEIYRYNPLLFDYVVKRTVHLPGTERKFPARIFMAHPDLPAGQLTATP